MKTTLSSTSSVSLGLACTLSLFGQTLLADQLWLQPYDGFGGDNHPYAVALDGSGNVAVTGSSMNQLGNLDYYTAKYAAGDGHLLWDVRYNGPAGGEDRGTGVAVDSAGNVIVTGYSANTNNPNGNNPFDFYTAKYAAADGQLLWERRGPYSLGYAVAPEATLIKRVAVDDDGNVVITGFSNGRVLCCEWSFYTAKYAAGDGHTLWEKWYVGPRGTDWPMGLALDGNGNVIVTGVSNNEYPIPGNSSIETIKYAASDGNVVWQRRYDSGTGGDDRPVGIAVDNQGNVFLSGVTVDSCCLPPPAHAYYTAKYAEADGTTLWEQVRTTPVDGATSRDFVVPQSIVVDGHGDVIVNQRTAAGLNNLVKYAGDDGRPLWGQVFQVGNCIPADPAALAVDGDDNVIATGHACLRNNCGAAQLLTSKYAAADGHLQWQQTFGAQAYPIGDALSSFSRGVAVDEAGNIVVAGKLRTTNGNFDYVTLKYRPSGSTLTTIHCPADIVTCTAPGQCSVVVNFSATATDACDNAVPVTCFPPSGSSFPIGTTTVTCSTPDGANCSFTVTVQNAIPTVTITGPPSGTVYSVGTAVNFTGSFTDNAGDTHTAQWVLDSTVVAGAVTEANGQVSASYTFTSPGVYLVKLIVTDQCGKTGTGDTVGGLPAMIVIYDPNGSFVTGGGWFNSPAGAYTAAPWLSGKASFGFVSKYQKGATVPAGETEFQFQVANFNFHSSSYEWLVISGARAQYKGSGTVNNAGSYGFILTAIDGQVSGGGGADKFRIKVWDKSNHDAIVYDNQLGASDSGEPTTAIAGGSIVIHK